MKFSTFKYHVGQGLRGMLKNGFMSLAAIATVAASCFILIFSLCVCFNIDSMLHQIESNLRINLYLGPDVTDEMVEDIDQRIRQIDHITEINYYTADDNLERAKNEWDNGAILEGLESDNPLPASFELGIDGAKYEGEVIKQLENLQLYVESELNAESDGVERIYLDENGNQISAEKAAQNTTEAAVLQTTAVQPSTEVVTSGAQADAEVTPQNSAAGAPESGQAEQPTAAASTPTQAAEPATAEAVAQTTPEANTETAAEETTAELYKPATSPEEFMSFINATVAATAGGNVGLSGSVTGENASGSADEGIAGVNVYDAAQYDIYEYEYKGIEKIRSDSDTSNTLSKINTAVRIFSIIVVVILCIIAVSIIMNTIRLTVVVRKNEINIMKYVGATDWFIRWPFIIEGMIIGFLGSIIPVIICFFAYNECLHLVTENIDVFNKIVNFVSAVDIFMVVAPVTVIFGILLGVIGSVSSMRKYLRV